MIRHLLKLVWHRKRSTGLLMLEIAVSFLVVFFVCAMGLRLAANFRRPLGFDWRPMWAVDVDAHNLMSGDRTAEGATRMQQLVREARALPRVEAAAATSLVPYEFENEGEETHYGSRAAMTALDLVGDGFDAAADLRVVAGRFFGPDDDGVAIPPVVVNRRLARALFDDTDPVGKVIRLGREERRVVGVIDEFRQNGEAADSDNYLFNRAQWQDPLRRQPRHLVLRMAPGTPASYEQEILDRLAPVAPGWSLSVTPLSALRHTRLRFQMAPMIVGGVVAGFLLLMVALGLLGVLWQNVTRRTRELGLRRAAGASRSAVHRQVLLELVLITSLAVAPALALSLQMPLFSPFQWLEPPLLALSIATALAVIFALALLCGLYPSRIATRLPPAEALRWE